MKADMAGWVVSGPQRSRNAMLCITASVVRICANVPQVVSFPLIAQNICLLYCSLCLSCCCGNRGKPEYMRGLLSLLLTPPASKGPLSGVNQILLKSFRAVAFDKKQYITVSGSN